MLMNMTYFTPTTTIWMSYKQVMPRAEKHKQTKWNSGAKKTKDVLELIHTYLSVLFLMDSWNEKNEFYYVQR